MIKSIPKLAADLQENPEQVIKDLEELRQIGVSPFSSVPYSLYNNLHHNSYRAFWLRFSVTGNILGLPSPRSIWKSDFQSSRFVYLNLGPRFPVLTPVHLPGISSPTGALGKCNLERAWKEPPKEGLPTLYPDIVF